MELNDFRVKSSKLNVEAIDVESVISLVNSFFNIGLIQYFNNQNIKTIILCGGMGTRLREETEFKPKTMVIIGKEPILWHIMKIYNHYNYRDFVLALGYKGIDIKDHFLRQKYCNIIK